MNSYIVKKTFLRGEINIPSSKSIAQRAIAVATMTKGTSNIKNVCFSEDVKTALGLAESLGAEIIISGSNLKITGNFKAKTKKLFVGEAGLSTRMFIPIAGLLDENFVINGKGSILKRPMNLLIKPLEDLGINIETNKGYLPLKISGKFHSRNITVEASESSQLLTGILMALPLTLKKTEIKVNNLKSKPYIDLTIEIMEKFGVKIINEDYNNFIIPVSEYKPTEINLEGDWSAAAFWFVAAAINGDLKILNLNPKPKQADKSILEVLKKAEIEYSYVNKYYLVKKSDIQAFEFDATDCPDLFPALAVLASNANGKSLIKGVHRLIHKESNRAEAILTEFKNLGVDISINEDTMIIQGKNSILGGIFNSYNDHRMAMAAAILALSSDKKIEITNYRCVSKSYPSFFEHLEQLSISEK